MVEVYQAVYLTSADQAIFDWQVSDFIPGKAETIIKSQSGDMELSMNNSTLGWFSLF